MYLYRNNHNTTKTEKSNKIENMKIYQKWQKRDKYHL